MKNTETEDFCSGENHQLNKNDQTGFSLVEVIIAMGILLVVLLGVFASITYAINYNSGNNSRSQSLAILQQEVEVMRSAKFTLTKTDNFSPTNPDTGKRDVTGGTKPTRIVTLANGNRFRVQTEIDDDPYCPGIQPETPFCATSILPSTLKEIKVTVSLDNPTPGWQTSVPATVILRRTRSN